MLLRSGTKLAGVSQAGQEKRGKCCRAPKSALGLWEWYWHTSLPLAVFLRTPACPHRLPLRHPPRRPRQPPSRPSLLLLRLRRRVPVQAQLRAPDRCRPRRPSQRPRRSTPPSRPLRLLLAAQQLQAHRRPPPINPHPSQRQRPSRRQPPRPSPPATPQPPPVPTATPQPTPTPTPQPTSTPELASAGALPLGRVWVE